MEINTDNYIYSPHIQAIKQLITQRECITLCGFPSSGKTRLIKRIISEMEIEPLYAFVDLELMERESGDLMKELQNEYLQGKRVYLIEEIHPDRADFANNLQILEAFRQSCVDRVSIIYSMTDNPHHYEAVLSDNRTVFDNLFYLAIDTNEYFKSIIKAREAYFDIKLSEKQIKQIEKATGGIPSLIKNMIKNIKAGSDYSEVKLYTPYLNKIYNSLSTLEINALKALADVKAVSPEMLRHLEQIGIVRNGKITSEFISQTVPDYSKNAKVVFEDGKLKANGSEIEDELTDKERLFLEKLLQEGEIDREEAYKLISRSQSLENYSEYQIDQFISRLRKKLVTLGVSDSFIKTFKGKGFGL